MAGYRRVGDRRGRLRFEIVGQAWGALKIAGSPPIPHNRTGDAPTDTPGPLSPGPAERARQRLDDLIGPEVLEPSPVAPEQTGRGVDTARTQETVQLLDISMSGALLASPEYISVGQRAKLRTTLGDEPFAVEIQVQHVSPDVKTVHEPTQFQLGVMFVSHDDPSLRCIQRFLNQKPE